MSDPEQSEIKKIDRKKRQGNGRLPANPTPGKCYVRSVTPPYFENYEKTYPVYIGGEIKTKELDTLKLVLEPAIGMWEYQTRMEGCRSSDPSDCMILCYVEYPEVSEEIIIVNNQEKKGLYENQTFVFREIKDAGGVAIWEEIKCTLTDYNELPITFYRMSTELNVQAKSEINSTLLQLMKDMPNIKVESRFSYKFEGRCCFKRRTIVGKSRSDR